MAKDMTKGNVVGLILGFALPVFLGNLFQSFYNIVDSVIVGRFVGVNALAAVGSTGSVMFCVQGLAQGLATGFGVVVAQTFGAKDQKGLRHYVAMSHYLMILVSVAATALLLFINRPVLRLLNTPDNIMKDASMYLQIIYAGFFVMMAYNLFAAVLRAIGDSRTPLYFLLLSSILNIILDLVFVINFRMGVAGVAYATVIAQAAAAALCFVYMCRKYPDVMKVQKDEAVFSMRSAGKLFGMGIPMALQFSITALGTMIVQSTLNLLGETAIAAFTAAQKLQGFVCQPYIALGSAMATYCGQNAGAGNMPRIKEGMKKTMLILMITVVIAFAAAWLVTPFGALLFVDASETEVIRLAVQYFHIASWFYPFLAAIFIYRNALQGIGFGLDAMLGGVFELAARGVLIWAIGTRFGYAGVCFTDPAAWIAALIPLIPLYHYRMKQAEKKMTLNIDYKGETIK